MTQNSFRRIVFPIFSVIFLLMTYYAEAVGGATEKASPVTDKIMTGTMDHKTNWHLSFEPLAGIKSGNIGEYLFYDDVKLSYLEWEEKPVWYTGGRITGEYKNISLSGYVTGSFPGRCGKMYDSDWTDLSDIKTDYSISENTLNSNINTGIALSCQFKPSVQFGLAPFIAFDFEYILLEARNGYGWYADKDTLNGAPYYKHSTHGYSYDSDMAVYYPSGSLLGIDYTRYTLCTWIGCTASIQLLNRLTFSIAPAFSPYIWIVSFDHHYGKGYYMDITDGWLAALKADFSVEYDFTKRFSAVFDCTLAKSRILYGNTYESSSGDSGSYRQLENYEGGASFSYISGSIGLRFLFF